MTNEAQVTQAERLALAMRNAIDMIEGALMGAGEMIDIPNKFEGARDDLLLMPKMTLGQMRRIVRELSECTRIINSEEFSPDSLRRTLPRDAASAGQAVAWLVDGPRPLDSSKVFLTHAKAVAAFRDRGKRITPLYAMGHRANPKDPTT